jgi:copper transport protein
LVPVAVSAHAVLLGSDPIPGAVLDAPPAQVTLIFSEPVTPAGAGIKVFSPSGAQVAGGVVREGATLRAAVQASEQGTYVVTWQVFASDTHPSRGAFAFSLVHSSANPFSALLDAGQAGTATPLGLALQAAARWVHFAGFALLFGVIAYASAVRRDARFRRLTGAGVVLLIAAEPLAVIAQLASLSFDGDTAIAVLGSEFGRLVGLRLGAALLAWTLLAMPRAWPVLAVGAVDAVLDGASAHGIAGVPLAGQVLIAVHVAAMGLWVGGLGAFVVAPERRFARYAAVTFGIAVVTGAVLGVAHTSFLTQILSSDYGRALLLKVVVVAAAVVFAVIGRHRRELVAASLAVGAAAVVAALPPPA